MSARRGWRASTWLRVVTLINNQADGGGLLWLWFQDNLDRLDACKAMAGCVTVRHVRSVCRG
jgi:hypothetical protein